MGIDSYLVSVKDCIDELGVFLANAFQISESSANEIISTELALHLRNFKDDCWLIIETGYVDKVYRNSYYNYYSSKLNSYPRHGVKLSLFDREVRLEEFRNPNLLSNIQTSYLGFIVLRPTEPYIVGRSVISPRALKNSNFVTCLTRISSTVLSVKLNVAGFPHSSQDGETTTCAETTLWAIMEYFSSKYPEYQSVLPSKIISTINKMAYERQIPSKGLRVNEISFALKKFGFAPRIYSKSFGSDFLNVLSCYIESGIPVIVTVDNSCYRELHPNEEIVKIAHACIISGREVINPSAFSKLIRSELDDKTLSKIVRTKRIRFFDFDDLENEFVFIDDNQPVYQRALLKQPGINYSDLSWKVCEISHFIVPLYFRIYVEAHEAKNMSKQFLINGVKPIKPDSEILIRTYLASSRSYKHYVAMSSSMTEAIKEIILDLVLPKFIWVTEVSDLNLIQEKKAVGFILIDATEPNSYNFEPVIMAAYEGALLKFNEQSRCLQEDVLSLQPFDIFEQNLL